MNSLAAPAFLDLSLGARKLRLRKAKRRCARGACRLVGTEPPILRRQSSLTFSRLRANRGLTRWHRICSRCGVDCPVAYKVQIWTLLVLRPHSDSGSHNIIAALLAKYHPSSPARWPFGLGRSGKVHTAENGLFIEPQLWSSPATTNYATSTSQWAPQGLKGMNYLPASLGPLQSGNGAGLGGQ